MVLSGACSPWGCLSGLVASVSSLSNLNKALILRAIFLLYEPLQRHSYCAQYYCSCATFLRRLDRAIFLRRLVWPPAHDHHRAKRATVRLACAILLREQQYFTPVSPLLRNIIAPATIAHAILLRMVISARAILLRAILFQKDRGRSWAGGENGDRRRASGATIFFAAPRNEVVNHPGIFPRIPWVTDINH